MVDTPTIILTLIILVIVYHSWHQKQRFTLKSDEKLNRIRDKLIRVDPRAANIKFFTNPEEAFTLGKSEIHMCMADPEGKYYSDDILMYIGLHELAHALIPEDTKHHPPKFDTMFNQLKERASYLGLYNPLTEFPTEYCGKKISYY